MPLRHWLEAPRRLSLLFLAVTLIPVLALGWLTSQLLEKDRQLEAQRGQERVEHAADRIIAASHQRLLDLESRLAQPVIAGMDEPPTQTVLAIATADGVTVTPAGGLVFLPVLPKAGEPPRDAFAEGERYEYQDGNLVKASAWFRTLTRANDPALRAGALLRLGRNQKKAGQADAALATYAELERLGATRVEGFPAALLALAARCGILEMAGRQRELATAAQALRTGLTSGEWPILPDAYDFYMKEARRWTGENGETEVERNARSIAAAFQMVTGKCGPGVEDRLCALPSEGGDLRSVGQSMQEISSRMISADGRRVAFTGTTRSQELWVIRNLVAEPTKTR